MIDRCATSAIASAVRDLGSDVITLRELERAPCIEPRPMVLCVHVHPLQRAPCEKEKAKLISTLWWALGPSGILAIASNSNLDGSPV